MYEFLICFVGATVAGCFLTLCIVAIRFCLKLILEALQSPKKNHKEVVFKGEKKRWKMEK